MTLISKVDALFQKVDCLHPTASSSGAPSSVRGQVNIYEMRGVQGHIISEFYLG